MPEDTQVIESQDISDNSETEEREPVQADNSDTPADEPEQNKDSQNNNEAENETVSDSNGFTDLETANKSYKELQKKLGEQGAELGNLRKQGEELNRLRENQNRFLNNLGFKSMEEFENAQFSAQYNDEIAKFEVSQYLEHANEAEFPDEVKKLITLYHSSSDPADKKQVLESIEANFSTETIKKIAADSALFKGQLDYQLQQAQNEENNAKMQNYLQNALKKYPDYFKDKNFNQLFGDAFSIYGAELNPDYVVNFYNGLVKSIEADVMKKHNIRIENENAKDRISDGINSRVNTDTKDILEMSEEEIRKELKRIK